MPQSRKQTSRPPSPAASAPKWVVVELSSAGEQEEKSIITRAVHRILKADVEVFVPALETDVRSDSQLLVYMDGYIFVRHEPGVQYIRLKDTNYFKDVLCIGSGGPNPTYALLDDSKISGLRSDMESVRSSGFQIDDIVVVKSGSMRGLKGVVVDIDGDEVSIKPALRSKPMILAYKTTYLERVKSA